MTTTKFCSVCDSLLRGERCIQHPLAKVESIITQAMPEPDICTQCAGRLYFSARQSGTGMCGPCQRITSGTPTESDLANGTAPSIEELIGKSSLGAALADIKERGIEAHLEDIADVCSHCEGLGTIEELYGGPHRDKFSRRVTCQACDGSGVEPDAH